MEEQFQAGELKNAQIVIALIENTLNSKNK